MNPYATVGAGALVIEDQKVLLVQPNYGPAQNAWILPGGFVEPGELPETCAVRELKEETNQAGEIIAPYCVRFRLTPADVYWVYLVRRVRESELIAQAEELSGIQFWNINDAIKSSDVRPLSRYLLETYLAKDKKLVAPPSTPAQHIYFFEK